MVEFAGFWMGAASEVGWDIVGDIKWDKGIPFRVARMPSVQRLLRLTAETSMGKCGVSRAEGLWAGVIAECCESGEVAAHAVDTAAGSGGGAAEVEAGVAGPVAAWGGAEE